MLLSFYWLACRRKKRWERRGSRRKSARRRKRGSKKINERENDKRNREMRKGQCTWKIGEGHEKGRVLIEWRTDPE